VGSFDYEGLHQSLEHLSQFEMEANSKVVESGVLEGINIDDIKKAGERLAFQDGCANFFEQILTKMDSLNVDVHIISVCWSGDIIRAAFSSSTYILYLSFKLSHLASFSMVAFYAMVFDFS